MNLVVYDDLVDDCKPGDEIEVIGIYRGEPVRNGNRINAFKNIFKTYVDVVSVIYPHKNKVVLSNEYYSDKDKINFTEEDIQKIKALSKNPDLY